jgi:outer membrane murein-binding lipoprotein Lpp
MIRQVIENPEEQAYWLDILDKVYDGTINSWGYIWMYTCWLQRGLCAVPNLNMISNLGFRADAAHTTDEENYFAALPTVDLWDIRHSPFVIRNQEEDGRFFHRILGKEPASVWEVATDLEQKLETAKQRYEELQQDATPKQAVIETLKAKLEQTTAENQELQATVAELKTNRKSLRKRQKALKAELETAKQTITAMEGSKFWKIRAGWIKLKTLFSR